MSSTFDGLYIARSGVRAARANLNITGQNITNADTDGYTRQRVDQSSIPPCGYGSFWAVTGATYGDGVSSDGISQLRDLFLDGEFRTQKAKSGASTTEVNSLYNIEDDFTTTSTADSASNTSVINVLSDAFSGFLSQLEALSATKSSASEGVVREQAKQLATKLNITANALKTEREKQYTDFAHDGLNDVNGLMKRIAALNKRIKDSEVSGSPALELKDQRNFMLDQLSKYVSINVSYRKMDVYTGKEVTGVVPNNDRTVDEMCVSLADTDGNPLTYDVIVGGKTIKKKYELIDNGDFAKFDVQRNNITDDSFVEGGPGGDLASQPFDITHLRLSDLSKDDGAHFDNGADVGDTYTGVKNSDIKAGSFAGYLQLLNESGEYDTASPSVPTTTFRGIGFYQQYLDTIAQNFASTLNDMNTLGCASVTKGGGSVYEVKPLFTGSAEGLSDVPTAAGLPAALKTIKDGITAENIHVAASWVDGRLTMSKEPPTNAKDTTSSSYSNILDMIGKLRSDKQTMKSAKGVTVFTDTYEKTFASVATMLGQDANSVQATDTTNSHLLNNINNDRQSVSSVSLDDEAVSIAQFGQSLNAASRFMTAVDECLQTIINNMGLCGKG